VVKQKLDFCAPWPEKGDLGLSPNNKQGLVSVKQLSFPDFMPSPGFQTQSWIVKQIYWQLPVCTLFQSNLVSISLKYTTLSCVEKMAKLVFITCQITSHRYACSDASLHLISPEVHLRKRFSRVQESEKQTTGVILG